MKVLEAGHQYDLENYDDTDEKTSNYLIFMKRIGGHYPGNVAPAHRGTNCQEVLRVLIDRVKYLNNQIPCIENEEIIRYLRYAIFMFESRAANLHGRPFDKVKDFPYIENRIEEEPTCKTCGHIRCQIKEHNNDIQRLSNGCESNQSLP